MYQIEEPINWLEPPSVKEIGYCEQCGAGIYEGEEIWEIDNKWYCEECIREAQKEVYKEDVYYA